MWAVIDIGTNSTRLLIAERNKSTGRVYAVRRMLRTTRIGEGLNNAGQITLQAAQRTLAALAEYQQVVSEYGADKVFLIGTQAMRQAANSREFAADVMNRFGWVLDVVSGEKEARLSYLGAVQGLQGVDNPVVIDIGGGSTEFIYTGPQGKTAACSLPLGALRHLENPVSSTQIKELFADMSLLKHIPAQGVLVGVGGTCTVTAAVRLGLTAYNPDLVQGLWITTGEVRQIYEDLRGKTAAERLKVPGLYPGREDIIIPGLEILLAVLEFLSKAGLVISDEDLLFGVIYEQEQSAGGK